jgi:hypothetical protein
MSIACALQELKLHNLSTMRYNIYALFLIQDYFGSKFCPSPSKITGFPVPA